MKCPNCGAELDGRFCSYCGHASAEQKEPIIELKPEIHVNIPQQPAPETKIVYIQKPDIPVPQEERNPVKTFFKVIFVLAGLFWIAMGIFFIASGGDTFGNVDVENTVGSILLVAGVFTLVIMMVLFFRKKHTR